MPVPTKGTKTEAAARSTTLSFDKKGPIDVSAVSARPLTTLRGFAQGTGPYTVYHARAHKRFIARKEVFELSQYLIPSLLVVDATL